MRLARQLHLYLGIFFAPSIMFFAFSGFLQTYSLHEGDNPTPWMVTLGEIHKNQRIPQAKPQEEAKPQGESKPQSEPGPKVGNAPAQSRPAGPRPQRRKKSVPLKIFMGFMAVGLIFSSLLGIYMSLKINRSPALMWGLLAAGTAIPVIALFAGM